jgi:hypothetical protein
MRWIAILAVLLTVGVLLPEAFADKPQAGGEGQVCMAGKKCRAGLTCNTANMCQAATTSSSSTTLPSKLGQACVQNSTCAPDICGSGGKCIAAGKLGEACAANSCAGGLTCSGAVCVAAPAAGDVGAACTQDTSCRQPDLKCGAAGLCVKR